MQRLFLIFLVASLTTMSSLASGQERELADRGKLFPSDSFFSLDIDGSFRMRTEFWRDVHMGLHHINKYGVYPQLSDFDDEESKVRESTDFRMRLIPKIGIGEKASVSMVVDLFSLEAGEGGVSDLATEFQSYYGIDAPGTFDSPLDSASIRALWAEVDLFHVANLKLGRIPSHFGMGLVENDGFGIDMDGGDAVDSIVVTADLWGYEVFVSWDWPLEGYSVENPFAPWAEAHDPGDLDDIIQFRAVVSQHLDKIKGLELLGWGFYNRLRWQRFSSIGSQQGEACQLNPWSSTFACTELTYRDAFIWTPSAWLKLVVDINKKVSFTMEAELAGRYGTISATRMLPLEDTERTLYGIGGVLRADFEWKSVETGLEFGAASGDSDSMAFGILDQPVIGEPDAKPGEDVTSSLNDSLTSFMLHPNYRPDLLLFRRIIGGVTNAWYLKAHGRFDLVEKNNSALWIDASVLYARAWVASSTPGDDSNLGLEGDLTLGGRVGDHVEALLQGGLLIPFAGLTGASKLADPLPWTVRLLLNFAF